MDRITIIKSYQFYTKSRYFLYQGNTDNPYHHGSDTLPLKSMADSDGCPILPRCDMDDCILWDILFDEQQDGSGDH